MVHGKQFAILNGRTVDLPGYRAIELAGGKVLSFHEGLHIACNDACSTVLLGDAWQVEGGMPSPREQVACLGTEELLEAEETWAGRYVLVVDGRISLDALGLLGVFYNDAGEVASDAAFLPHGPASWKPSPPLDYFPGPLTPWEGIRRLLPSQMLEIWTGRVMPRPLLADRWACGCDDLDSLTGKVIDAFSVEYLNLAAAFPETSFLVALSGGYDSRTVLALAQHAGLEVECFTMEYPDMAAGDRDYPPQLCGLIGCGHHAIGQDPARYSQALDDEVTEHLSGIMRDADQDFHAHGQYEELERRFGDATLLRGGMWTVPKTPMGKHIGSEPDVRAVLDFLEIGSGRTLEDRSIRELMDWIASTPQAIPYVNRFYLDFRSASWLSECEHFFDLYDCVRSVQVGNCRKTLTLLMQYPAEMRLAEEHQLMLIARCRPELLEVPFAKEPGYDGNALRVLSGRLGLAGRRLGNLGPKRTLQLYMRRIANRNG